MNQRPQNQRPSRRRSSRRLALISLGVLVVAAVPLAYLKYRLDLAPAAPAGTTSAFTVNPGENAQTIATHLATAHLIRDRNAFITYINLHGLRPRLKAGQYALKPSMTAEAIALAIADGRTLTKRLLVPEGYRLSQIETSAAELGITKAGFAAALAAPHRQSFLAGKPANVGLEGYLFPDSYEISATTTATELVNAMLDTFGKRVGPEYVQAFAAQGLTLHQGLTLASMVEREVRIPEDRPIVAQVFLKRFKTGMPLGSDVTAQYASDLLGVPFNVDVNSPYNTRRFPGLPPGPICSPGLGALDAVAHPAGTDYLYFLTGRDGKDYFAKTLAEHNANIAKHL
jgi:UPF0755 protein